MILSENSDPSKVFKFQYLSLKFNVRDFCGSIDIYIFAIYLANSFIPFFANHRG